MDNRSQEAIEEDVSFPWGVFMSLACSLLIILGGMFWTYRIWTDSNHKFHELSHVEETVQGLRSRVEVREASIR
jgi:hypothetical protein